MSFEHLFSKIKQSLGLWNFLRIVGEPDVFTVSFAGSPRGSKNSLCDCKLLIALRKLLVLYFKTRNECNNPWLFYDPNRAFYGSHAVALQSIFMSYF